MDVNRPCQSSQHGKVIKQIACPADPATMYGVGARIVRTAQRGDFGVTTKSSFLDRGRLQRRVTACPFSADDQKIGACAFTT